MDRWAFCLIFCTLAAGSLDVSCVLDSCIILCTNIQDSPDVIRICWLPFFRSGPGKRGQKQKQWRALENLGVCLHLQNAGITSWLTGIAWYKRYKGITKGITDYDWEKLWDDSNFSALQQQRIIKQQLRHQTQLRFPKAPQEILRTCIARWFQRWGWVK